MIGCYIFSNSRTIKMIIIVFILGGDESVKHRTSAHSVMGKNLLNGDIAISVEILMIYCCNNSRNYEIQF